LNKSKIKYKKSNMNKYSRAAKYNKLVQDKIPGIIEKKGWRQERTLLVMMSIGKN